jgi:YfiR/HmsC-like
MISVRPLSRRRLILSLFRAVLLTLSVDFFATHYSWAETDDSSRVGRIRSALVYYVVKFVTFDSSVSQPIRLCIVGDDPLNAHIKGTLIGKSVVGRPIEVEMFEGWQPSAECHVIFFAENSVDKSTLSTLPRQLLTICAVSEVSWDSCIVQMFVSDNKARLAVDLDRARAHGFEVGSELLEVAVTKKGKDR